MEALKILWRLTFKFYKLPSSGARWQFFFYLKKHIKNFFLWEVKKVLDIFVSIC